MADSFRKLYEDLNDLYEEDLEYVRDDYKKFVDHIMKELQINFHPDDSFDEYINYETGELLFTPEEAEELNKKMEYFAEKLGDEIYDYPQKVFDELAAKNTMVEDVEDNATASSIRVEDAMAAIDTAIAN